MGSLQLQPATQINSITRLGHRDFYGKILKLYLFRNTAQLSTVTVVFSEQV